MQAVTDTKIEKVAGLIAELYPAKIDRLLVVGCGDGIEAAELASKLQAKVTGIDVATEKFESAAAELADLQHGDAMALGFDDDTFDFVFSYHALEHIEDPNRALREMHRVLKPGGGFWIGTPNRTRIVGYISAREGSMRDRIKWNLDDYRARLSGRFRNEFGAHAGYSASELQAMLASIFTTVDNVSHKYFRTIYPRLEGPLKIAAPLSGLIYPSIYFSGRK